MKQERQKPPAERTDRMECTEECLSTREWIHKMVNMIQDEGDLAMVKWLMQPYVARSLNKKHKEEETHEA